MRVSQIQGPRTLGAVEALVNSGEPVEFQNPNAVETKALLQRLHTIAIVGLSFDPDRPSYSVAMYLQNSGYRIVPVRPDEGEILGEKIYPTLTAIPFQVDAADIFRRSVFAGAHVDEAIALKLQAVWLQEGVIDEAAAARARKAGLFVTMDRCMLKEHRKAGLASRPPPVKP
jgi:predicted CoA-binding protein